MTTQPLYVDNSTLSALAACDMRALLRFVHGWTSSEESMALQTGIAIHTALEVYFKTSQPLTALKAFREAYQAWADEHVPANPTDEQRWVVKYSFDNVRDILKTWLRRHPLDQEPYKVFPDLVEVGFAFPLAEDIIFYGRYDAIVEERTSGQLMVLDHKTTGQFTSDWAQAFRTSTQITGYTWAAMQLLGKRVAGAIINGIQISKLPDLLQNKDGSFRKCREHGLGVDECRLTHVKESLAITQRTPEQIAQWQAGTIKLARRLQKLIAKHPTLDTLGDVQTQGMYANACRWCDFRAFCEVGRPVDRLPQMLTYRPWKPYEPKGN